MTWTWNNLPYRGGFIRACTHSRESKRTHTHTHTHRYTHTHTPHAHAHTHRNTRTHTYAHTHTHVHTRTHIHTHTHTHREFFFFLSLWWWKYTGSFTAHKLLWCISGHKTKNIFIPCPRNIVLFVLCIIWQISVFDSPWKFLRHNITDHNRGFTSWYYSKLHSFYGVRFLLQAINFTIKKKKNN